MYMYYILEKMVLVTQYMNRKFKLRWLTIPPLSIKRTITFHLNSKNIKNTLLEIQVVAWDSLKLTFVSDLVEKERTRFEHKVVNFGWPST